MKAWFQIRRRTFQFKLRTLLLFMVVLGCIFAAIGLALRRNPQAVAYLRIAPPISTTGFVDVAAYQSSPRSHRTNIKSSPIIDAALAKAEVAQLPLVAKNSNAADWLQQNLRVSQPLESELIVLKLSCKRLDEANRVLDAIIDAYVDSLKNSGDAKQVKSLGRSRIG